jgi:hypothetical protein
LPALHRSADEQMPRVQAPGDIVTGLVPHRLKDMAEEAPLSLNASPA